MAEDNYTYNESEVATVKFVTKTLYEPAKKFKWYYAGDKHEKWISDIKWYKGQQWATNRPKDKSSITFNRIFSGIQQELPFMTARRPQIYVQPEEPGDKVWADIIKRIIETAWIERGMDMKLPEAVMHAKQLGTGFFRVFWNPELANGLGDIDAEPIDPLEVFPFPYTKQLASCTGMFWCRYVSLSWIRKNYPKEGWRVKPNKNDYSKDIPDRAKETSCASKEGYEQVTDTTGAQTDYLPATSGTSYDSQSFNRILIYTCYLKDEAEIEEKAEEGEYKGKKVAKKQYPNGRVITIANGIVLEDIPFPFENIFPGFVEIKNYIDPGEFWGTSDVTMIKDGQKGLNKINASIFDAVNNAVYPQNFVQEQSGIDADDYVTTAGSIYPTRVPNPVTQIGQWSMPQDVFNYPQTIEQSIAKTAGTSEYAAPSSGDLPSGRSLMQFQEITQTRLRQKIMNMEYGIRMIGKMWLEMILKNYTEQRVMRIMNERTNQPEYVFIFREENPQRADGIKQQVAQEIIPGTEQKDPQTGQPVQGSGEKKYQYILNMADVKGGLDLTVATGSTVSVSKLASFEQSFQLFQVQAIDQEALLNAADYPNKEEILKRMNQQMQQAQQQQMQMAQQAMQVNMGLEQGKLQTDVQTTQMDNQTDLVIAQMKNGQQARQAMMKGGNNAANKVR